MPCYASHFISEKMEFSFRPFLFLITLWAFCFHLNAGFVQSQCLQDQQHLLIQLKGNLTFNSTLSFKLVSWNSSVDCCLWAGVTCSGGYVIGLDLSRESISGGIDNSSCLFDLHRLQSLDLALNLFNGSWIPPALGKLANLLHLNLSNAGFSGQIPVEISGLTSLISLHLSASESDTEVILKAENPNVSVLLRNLTRLTELDLQGIDLSAQGGGWCGALSLLTRLKVLNLAYCGLSGPIDSSLAKLRSLSVIKLSANNIYGPVPEIFGNFTDLTSLELLDCGLYGKFPVNIFRLPHLQSLDISYNTGLHGLLPEFPENASLQILWLSGTSFGGNLPESIGNLGRLSVIDLSDCKFNGSIPDTVSNLTHLVFLDFANNSFSGLIPSFSSANNLNGALTASSGLASALVRLVLSDNKLEGPFPTSVFQLRSLRVLDLSSNKLEGNLLTRAFQLRSLAYLDLRNNKFVGPLPMWAFQLKSLQFFSLSSNNFSGPVDLSSFQQLKNLSEIDLSYNRFSINETGIDPVSFPKLSRLKMASCNLTRFPAFLKEQSQLEQLDLSNNQIGGDIPNWMWSLGKLDVLNLSHNFLMNLQEPLKGFNHSLAFLDLSSNNLQGELPVNIMYVDIFISLSNNNFHGSIPRSICNASNLGFINLSNNSLNGTIPQCLFRMNQIGVLNLRGNNLNGNIADIFQSDCPWLQTLDLNGNQLEGKIPRSLANCRSLEVLDLGNNQIHDAFPTRLEIIPSLRVLVLRSNYLHGAIDCEADNSSWPMLQIIDLSSNQFSGELPVQCLRKWKGMMMADRDEQQVFPIGLGAGSLNYLDSITVTMKGMELQLVKILTIFNAIDFSCNNFEGNIPEAIGELRALYVLNLSHNSFAGLIPSSLGNLGNLESLDLSSNNLSGEIPQQLADLNFLAVFNVSHNQLEGRIPSGNQFQTFPEDSFRDNKGLCGVPLKESCSPIAPPGTFEDKHSDDGIHVNWKYLSVELGFVFGLGIVILPLMFWRRWRIWYYKHVDILLSRLLHRLNQRSRNCGGRIAIRTGTKTQLREKNKMTREVALQPRVSKNLRTGRRTSGVIVV